jgi:plasmid stabilization system protein ParE
VKLCVSVFSVSQIVVPSWFNLVAALSRRDYPIFYRVDADIVEIIRVLHGARDLPRILEEDNG